MKKALTSTLAFVAASALAVSAFAGPDEDKLILNGEIEMVTTTAAPAHIEGLDTIYSGWHFRDDTTQAMQMDDFDNPAMLAVEEAIETWNTAEGSEGKSCADCHGAPEEMAGVRAVYPKWDEAAGQVMTLDMKMNECRTTRMGAEAWKPGGDDEAAMAALISSVSRGMPVNVAIDGPAQSTWEKGKEIYYTRFGKLELSCANCHENNYGNMIRADHLSQGQINGFPVYRLKNSKLTTPQGRFKGCVRDTIAETFDVGSPEFIALELYVASRGNGLSVEGPSVRN